MGFQRLINTLQNAPPWLWMSGGRLWQRLGSAPLWRLPLELLQQLHWWFIQPWRWPRCPPKGRPALPWQLTLPACWLNSYKKTQHQVLIFMVPTKHLGIITAHTSKNQSSQSVLEDPFLMSGGRLCGTD